MANGQKLAEICPKNCNGPDHANSLDRSYPTRRSYCTAYHEELARVLPSSCCYHLLLPGGTFLPAATTASCTSTSTITSVSQAPAGSGRPARSTFEGGERSVSIEGRVGNLPT